MTDSNLTSIGSVTVEKNVPVPMRDGVTLYADIYRPAVGDKNEKYPVLLMRTPYNKEDAQTMNYAHPAWYARQGYVVVVQDVRGRWTSEGEFHPYAKEAEDGYDTVEWAASLPGVVPKVGMYGFSYVGAAQWFAAISRPPHLACIAPGMIGSDSYQGKAYRNGAFALACTLSWILFVAQDTALRNNRPDRVKELSSLYAGIHGQYTALPLNSPPDAVKETAPYYLEWLEHPARDDYWRHQSLLENYESIEVPALHIGGWYDIFIDGTIENYLGVSKLGATERARNNQYLLIEPWYHMPWSRYVGDVDFGPEAANEIDSVQLQWFDRWLKEVELATPPPSSVRLFVMGVNKWLETKSWPVQGSQAATYYLHSLNKANSVNGDGKLSLTEPLDEPPDLFVYHPSIPVPALGGRSGAVPDLTPMGPKNQLPIEIRNDVLVYTSEVLIEDLTVIGEVTVELYASTSAEDTDFVAKLIDVHPDGRSINIAEGIVRASYRDGLEKPKPVTPGEVIRFVISLGPTANVFKQGHAIRLDITSSLFPTFDRNPNRFMNSSEATAADFVTATQTIYHDRRFASRLTLPVISGKQELFL